MKSNILITGASGYLGKYFLRKIISIKDYNINLLFEDINNFESIRNYFSSNRIDVVVHLAALVASKANQDEMMKTNLEATKNLANLIDKNTHFIVLSSDHVFKSDKEKIYKTEDIKDPETLYGKSKHLAEEYLSKNVEKLTVLRTSMLYGYNDSKRNNFFKFLIDNLKKLEKIDIYSNVYNQPTHVSDVSDFIIKIIREKKFGFFHALGDEYLNRFELGKMFCEIHGYNIEYLNSVKQQEGGRIPNYLNLQPSQCFLENKKYSLEMGLKQYL